MNFIYELASELKLNPAEILSENGSPVQVGKENFTTHSHQIVARKMGTDTEVGEIRSLYGRYN